MFRHGTQTAIPTEGELCGEIFGFNDKPGRSEPRFATPSTCPCIPLLAPWDIFSNGSALSAKPRPEEREGGAGKTIVGGTKKSHLDAVGSLHLWVSCIVDYYKSDWGA